MLSPFTEDVINLLLRGKKYPSPATEEWNEFHAHKMDVSGKALANFQFFEKKEYTSKDEIKKNPGVYVKMPRICIACGTAE